MKRNITETEKIAIKRAFRYGYTQSDFEIRSEKIYDVFAWAFNIMLGIIIVAFAVKCILGINTNIVMIVGCGMADICGLTCVVTRICQNVWTKRHIVSYAFHNFEDYSDFVKNYR